MKREKDCIKDFNNQLRNIKKWYKKPNNQHSDFVLSKRFTKVKKTKKEEDRNEFIKAMEEDITSLHKSQPYDLKELPN